jgi:hypothetical protein
MADEAQLAILRQGVEVWNAWRQSDKKIPVDLRNADLSNADLSNANLSDAILNRANLRNADLSRSNLCRANLRRANLRRANLKFANLSNADLSFAILTDATLRGVDLSDAHLSDAILIKADLTDATLGGADFRNADLSSTLFVRTETNNIDMTKAECNGTIFSEVSLSTVKGLETITHMGPSTLGIDTIYRTQTRLPEVFLRGCGVPEILIQYLPSMLGQAINFYSCFISHSHADKSFARRLHDTLQGHGIRCWLDEKNLVPGEDLYEGIQHGIRYWDKILVCCSKSSLSEKWWVDHEIDLAF